MLKLGLFVLGIYVCFLTWGITQERVSTTLYKGERFKFFVFLNTCQALVAALVANAYIKIEGKSPEPISKSLAIEYLKISLLSCIASPFGYAALKHIDYPTLILGKTSKLVPVALMNFVIYRKIYPLKKYLVVALITLGVSSFMLLHPQEVAKQDKNSSLYGLGLLAVNLLLDGAYNSTQDQVFHRFHIKGTTMMMYMNLFSFVLMALYLALNPYSNELSSAVAFFTSHPAIITDIMLFCITGALGQVFIFLTLHSFGSIILVTVTVTRKMFSILLSVIMFGHAMNLGQWLSVALVFIAICWDAMGEKSSEVKTIYTSTNKPRRSKRLMEKKID